MSAVQPAATPLDRGEFAVTSQWTYLNTAGMAAIPVRAADAMHARAMELAVDGELAWDEHKATIERVRADGARIMGVPAADVAFIKNTTEGLGLVANGLDLGPGDRVVAADLDFPSTLLPWVALRERGVRVDLVRPRGDALALPVEAFAEAIAEGPPPAVVTTSWVGFRRGWRVDAGALATVAHEAGALLCLDVIQGLGVVPAELDAWGVDFAMADGHKWLLGAAGTGLLYVRGEHRDRLRPLQVGWNSMSHREQWNELGFAYDTTARRYEGGSPNVPGVAGLGVSLELLLAAGVPAVWSHVDALCRRVEDGLRELGATVFSDRSGAAGSAIVSCAFPGRDVQAIGKELRARGIVCGIQVDALRVAPHGFNTEEEIGRLLEALDELT